MIVKKAASLSRKYGSTIADVITEAKIKEAQ
jgi:hypothetical protein